MENQTITLWNVPVECVLEIIAIIRKHCSKAITEGADEKAEHMLYCIRKCQEDLKDQICEVTNQ